MRVLEDWIDQRLRERLQRGGAGCGIGIRAFAIPPSVIPTALSRRLVVDLFPRRLANVPNQERPVAAARRVVKVVPPGVSQPEGPDLREDAGDTDVRIVPRNAIADRIAGRYGDVNPQHLP